MRPWKYWLAFTVFLAVLGSAMGWISHTLLNLDRLQADARKIALYEENVRLALWRMETALVPILTAESSRPYFLYSSFYPVEPVPGEKTKAHNQPPAVVPSPLINDNPDYANLYFQWDKNQGFSSPQVPTGGFKQVSVSTFSNSIQIESAQDRLADLQKTVDEAKLLSAASGEQKAQRESSYGWLDSTLSFTSWNRKEKAGADADTAAAPAMNQMALDSSSTTMKAAPPNRSRASKTSGGNQKLNQKEEEVTFQTARNYTEYEVRQEQQIANIGNAQRSQTRSAPALRGETAPSMETAESAAAPVLVEAAKQKKMQSKGGAAEKKDTAQTKASKPKAAEKTAATAPTANTTRSPDVKIGPMSPVWEGNMLLLVRKVTVNGTDHVQGCWLNWDMVRKDLLDRVSDLFPDAGLEPVKNPRKADAGRLLAGLPLKFDPGRLADDVESSTTPVRYILIFAWICTILAAAAVGILLAGAVALGERRGAFVSAVTHELRTPLTTFRMYTEMLAEGMIKDEQKRRQYLQTLCAEGNRLSHLVENVLSFARLERGRAGAETRNTPVKELVGRISERLDQRATQAGMKVEWHGVETASDLEMLTDISATEQILFNLVDNACKYAARAENKTIHVEISDTPKHIRFRVRDHGPGVPPDVLKRLFRPFSKSVQRAAETAPGVGLGLALSRRLARQMRGDLVLAKDAGTGAVFDVLIPKAPQIIA